MTWAAVAFLAFVTVGAMYNEERLDKRDIHAPLWGVLAVVSVVGIVILVLFR